MSRRRIKNRAQRRVPRNVSFMSDELGDFGGVLTAERIFSSPQSREETLAYIRAHELLPPSYRYDGSTVSVSVVKKAAELIETPNAPDEHLMAAIVLLGHSPCHRAVDALTAFCGSDHPLAGSARFALIECQQLFMTPYPGVVPETSERSG